MKWMGAVFSGVVLAGCASSSERAGPGVADAGVAIEDAAPPAAGSGGRGGRASGGAPAAGGAPVVGGSRGSGGSGVAAGGAAPAAGGRDGTGGAGSGSGGAAGARSSVDGGAGGSAAADCAAEDGDGKTTLVFVNDCAGALTYRGSDIPGGSIAPGSAECVDIGSDVETLSAKRYWGFLGEDPGGEHHTLAEFTFNTDFNDFDWYNISHVDAHNLPMQITPLDRPNCKTLSCPQSFLDACPDEGILRDSEGVVVACVSPNRDDGESPVALYFETCDDAYAWSGDDQHGSDPSPVAACAGEDWEIRFCP